MTEKSFIALGRNATASNCAVVNRRGIVVATTEGRPRNPLWARKLGVRVTRSGKRLGSWLNR